MTNEKKQELDALCLKFRRTLIEILHEKQTILDGIGTVLTLIGLFLSENKPERNSTKNG